MIHLHLAIIKSSYTVRGWLNDVSLTIKSAELRFILSKIVLTVLNHSLIVSKSSNTSFAFGLCVFVCVFNFLFSLLHVTWPCRLLLLMQRPTQYIFWIFDVKPLGSFWSIGVRWARWIGDENLIIIMAFALPRIFILINMFFICKVETCTISHMHFETPWGKTLGLRLLNSSNLLFWMAHRTVMLLVVLLNQLIVLLLVIEFLSVACNSGLTRINWSLQSCYHAKEVSIFLGVSNVIKPRMLQSLLSRESFSWVHFEQANHQA